MSENKDDLLKNILVGGAAIAGALLLNKTLGGKGGSNNYIYIATNEKFWHFEGSFKCLKCNKPVKIRTGYGRYGMLGGFECPHCKAKLFAEIDDHQDPDIRIYKEKDMPGSMLDNHKHGYITIHPKERS